ncbi:unnamed protein product, partial [Brassica rapa subsp. narinosa]
MISCKCPVVLIYKQKKLRITSGPCTYGMVMEAYLSYTWPFEL